MAYRVGYTIPVQGFRPATNPGKAAGLLGLRGMGDSNAFSGCVSAMDANGNPVSCSDPSAAVWFDANMNAVAPGTAAAASSAPAAEAPTGAYLTYNGTWSSTPYTSAKTIYQKVIDSLQSQGLQVTNSNIDASFWANYGKSSAPFNVVLYLRVIGPGFAHADDARSIVDHMVYVQSGSMPQGSFIFVASSPSVPTTPGAAAMSAQPQNFTQWFESNAWWIGALIVGAVVLPKVL